jgi:hypothetical protein
MLVEAARRQRAARHLWLDGQTAEGYALAVEAFGGFVRGLSEAAGVESETISELPEIELKLGSLSDADSARLACATLAQAHALEVPTSDAEFTSAHALILERIWQSQLRLQRGVERLLGMAPPRRGLVMALLLGAGLVAAIVALASDSPPRTRASASYSDEYGPHQAVDGIEATEWLLPDGKSGWLELMLKRPKAVSRVELRNCHNRSYNDRATRKFKIEIFDGERLRAAVEGEYEKFDPEPSWRVIAVPLGRTTRIRVLVLSHFGTGGGLAEVRLR